MTIKFKPKKQMRKEKTNKNIWEKKFKENLRKKI